MRPALRRCSRTPKAFGALKNLGAEFAVAGAGADLHLWPDRCNCADDFPALAHRDAVPAAQCRFWPEDTQNSSDTVETVSCIFEQLRRTGYQSPIQICKTVTAHREFPRRTARLQRPRDVEKGALVTVDLMRETALQSLACVIQPLLRVAYPVEKLTRDRARATVDSPPKLDNIGHN